MDTLTADGKPFARLDSGAGPVTTTLRRGSMDSLVLTIKDAKAVATETWALPERDNLVVRRDVTQANGFSFQENGSPKRVGGTDLDLVNRNSSTRNEMQMTAKESATIRGKISYRNTAQDEKTLNSILMTQRINTILRKGFNRGIRSKYPFELITKSRGTIKRMLTNGTILVKALTTPIALFRLPTLFVLNSNQVEMTGATESKPILYTAMWSGSGQK